MRARRDHRPADRGEEAQETRLRLPPGARGRDDAPAGAAPSRHPAARHRRKHLARHHRDLHLCAGAVFGACRSLGGRRADARFRPLPFRLHRAVRRASRRRRRGRGGLGIRRAISAWCRRSPWPAPAPGGRALEFDTAPKIIARLPFVERADHPAALPVFAISRAAADAMVTEVATWSIRVSGWGATPAAERRRAGRPSRGARPRLRRRGAAGVAAAGAAARRRSATALIKSGASVRSAALVGSHATRYTVPATIDASIPRMLGTGIAADRQHEIHERKRWMPASRA